MAKRKIIYNPKLKEFARQLRNDSTKTEIFFFVEIARMYGYDFTDKTD
jgi:very-short-patch-repair endonuclease